MSEISQGRIFGYARVSSTEQNLDRQLAELAKYVLEENVVTNKQSEKGKGRGLMLQRRKENEMDEFKFNVETTVIGTADGKEVFEVRKQYNIEGKSAII